MNKVDNIKIKELRGRIIRSVQRKKLFEQRSLLLSYLKKRIKNAEVELKVYNQKILQKGGDLNHLQQQTAIKTEINILKNYYNKASDS